ncbi:MAG: hypothetical protein ACYC35_15365 [Pirellulales bacterium]
MTNRAFQLLMIASTVAVSWLGMMAVHEIGHVLTGRVCGGTIEKVVLHPLAFSRTDPGENPYPLVFKWGGAVWGCILPLAGLAAVRVMARSQAYLAAFFARFCLVANGAYFAGGAVLGDGDAGDLIRGGSARWPMIVFGILAVTLGLYLWHGLGPHFGLGASAGKVDRRAAVGVSLALTLVVVLELLLSGKS